MVKTEISGRFLDGIIVKIARVLERRILLQELGMNGFQIFNTGYDDLNIAFSAEMADSQSAQDRYEIRHRDEEFR